MTFSYVFISTAPSPQHRWSLRGGQIWRSKCFNHFCIYPNKEKTPRPTNHDSGGSLDGTQKVMLTMFAVSQKDMCVLLCQPFFVHVPRNSSLQTHHEYNVFSKFVYLLMPFIHTFWTSCWLSFWRPQTQKNANVLYNVRFCEHATTHFALDAYLCKLLDPSGRSHGTPFGYVEHHFCTIHDYLSKAKKREVCETIDLSHLGVLVNSKDLLPTLAQKKHNVFNRNGLHKTHLARHTSIQSDFVGQVIWPAGMLYSTKWTSKHAIALDWD